MTDTGTDKRRPGWHWANNDILDTYGPLIGAYGIAVYYVLARHANQDREAWPSVTRIAEMIGASKPTTRAALDKLAEVGLIAVHQRTENGAHLSNHYELLDVGGSKARLPLVKEIDQGGKGDLPGVVKDVDQGSKARLPEQERDNKTHETRPIEQETPPPSGAVPGSAPVKGKSSRAKPDAPEPEQRLMFGAVATVCRLDPRLKAGQIGKTAKQLLAAGYTPAQVEAFPAWFKSHWKGKTGQPPSTGDLLALMLQATQAPNGKPGPATGQQWADTSYEALKARYAPDALQGLIEY